MYLSFKLTNDEQESIKWQMRKELYECEEEDYSDDEVGNYLWETLQNIIDDAVSAKFETEKKPMKYTLEDLKTCLDALKLVRNTKATLVHETEIAYRLECEEYIINQNEDGRFEAFPYSEFEDLHTGALVYDVSEKDWLKDATDHDAKSPYYVAKKIVMNSVGELIDAAFDDGVCGEGDCFSDGINMEGKA